MESLFAVACRSPSDEENRIRFGDEPRWGRKTFESSVNFEGMKKVNHLSENILEVPDDRALSSGVPFIAQAGEGSQFKGRP